MKRAVYIVAFAIFGFLAQLLVVGVVETWHMRLLQANFEAYSFGLTFPQVLQLHYSASLIFAVLGLGLGVWQGFYWWQVIYIEKRFKKFIKENF